jgi:SAM-dependent methyltransferase
MTTTTFHPVPAGDPYARIAGLDEATVAALADRIDLRAADPNQRRLWRDFLGRAPHRPAARVLEVGCGTGVITAMIADRPGVTEAVGVDPGAGFVARARRRCPGLRFEVADGRALPFAGESFDGVVFATTLCHIPEPERALAEARRVLRPDGYLLVYDGDYAATTVALGADDPLQSCVAAAISALVHDPWLMRRLRPMLTGAGFHPGEACSHGYLELDAPAYLPSLVAVGADALVARRVLAAEGGAAMQAEVRKRAADGRFFGHIAYFSVLTGPAASPPGPR